MCFAVHNIINKLNKLYSFLWWNTGCHTAPRQCRTYIYWQPCVRLSILRFSLLAPPNEAGWANLREESACEPRRWYLAGRGLDHSLYNPASYPLLYQPSPNYQITIIDLSLIDKKNACMVPCYRPTCMSIVKSYMLMSLDGSMDVLTVVFGWL